MSHRESSISTRTLPVVLALGLLAVFALAACGKSSTPTSASSAAPKTSAPPAAAPSLKQGQVNVTANEFTITSTATSFKTGTPYTFVITDAGKVAHDWMIMPAGSIDEDKALIKVEDDELTPGATVTKEYTFASPGSFEMACHVAGHYEAGMKLPITVTS